MDREKTDKSRPVSPRKAGCDNRTLGYFFGAAAAVSVLSGTATGCRTPGNCLQCGICAGVIPMAAVAGLVAFFGVKR
jgi:hypothetical protein